MGWGFDVGSMVPVRAYDEPRGVWRLAIWTAKRDREIWAALQG